jgi:hypothetical protein
VTVMRHVLYSSLTCLRGPVSGGAEKEKDLELPEKGLYLFMILNSWTVYGLQAALLYPLALEMIRIFFKVFENSAFFAPRFKKFRASTGWFKECLNKNFHNLKNCIS